MDKCVPLCWAYLILERHLGGSGGVRSSEVLMHQRTLKSPRISPGERCGKPTIMSLGVTTAQPGAWSCGHLLLRKVRNYIRRASATLLPSVPTYLVSNLTASPETCEPAQREYMERVEGSSSDLSPGPPLPLLAGDTTAVETSLQAAGWNSPQSWGGHRNHT